MRRLTARAVLAAAGLAILLALAGCGGGDKTDTGLPGFDGARVSWGEPDGGDPTAVMMLLHGGGWQRSDSGYEEQKANAKVVQEQGYATVAVGYDAGAKGFQQVVDVYKAARERYPDLPICAVGISAGGNLALNLAAREPDLDCVVSLSAPTDLTTVAQQDPQGEEAYKAAVEAFGKNALVKFSPVRHADQIKAKVLLIAADTDPIVPAAQSRELAQALPGVQLVDLPAGPDQVEWAHFGRVQPDAQQIVIQREFDFLKQATAAKG
jgi:dipeptidyl aminopeptidase/acylaminoacyl peptidase